MNLKKNPTVVRSSELAYWQMQNEHTHCKPSKWCHYKTMLLWFGLCMCFQGPFCVFLQKEQNKVKAASTLSLFMCWFNKQNLLQSRVLDIAPLQQHLPHLKSVVEKLNTTPSFMTGHCHSLASCSLCIHCIRLGGICWHSSVWVRLATHSGHVPF